MRLRAFFAFMLASTRLYASADSSSAAGKSLPACSAIDRPCKCPAGTTFKNLTSYGVIGAPAADVREIMGKFLNITFQGGLVPQSTTGREYQAGATRTFNFSGPSGYYQITEKLVQYQAYPDGSFLQKDEQDPKDVPVQVPGAGAYYGTWAVIQGQQTLIPNETAVSWKNWRCETGVTFPAGPSHEGGIANTSAILASAGKRTGVDIKPFTIFYETRQD